MVALYVRVSTADKGQDVKNQVNQLKEFCNKRGFTIFQIYQDNFTGSAGRKERSGFDQLFKDARLKKFDTVIFWSLDRFTREGVYMTMTYLRQLNDYGVKFISLTEEYLSTENELVGNILITVLSYFAELERKKISERTKASMQRLKEAGIRLGKKPLDPDKINLIKKLLSANVKPPRVARMVGCSLSSVKKYGKDKNVLSENENTY